MPSASTPKVALASSSPRRAELLRSAGVAFTIAAANCNEDWHAGESPTVYVERVATLKARSALATTLTLRAIVLAADTAVWIDHRGPPLGKPRDRDAARGMLRDLFDAQQHFVSTAFILIDARTPGTRPRTEIIRCVTTRVWTRALEGRRRARCIERYLDTDEWTDKAGGYGIQGRAAGLMARIDGSYTAIVGLPLAELLDALTDILEA
jgi:septum formation protein